MSALQPFNNDAEDNLPWSEEGSDDEEEAFNLGEVSSDVEIDPAELDGIDFEDDDETRGDSAYVMFPPMALSRHLTRI